MKKTALRVSIVEDDSSIRETLHSLFIFEEDMEPFSVHSNAEDALVRLNGTCPDVVIMDINLPGASGIDCVRQLSERCAGTQFLMYTVHDDDHRVFEALKAGANGYILKSSTPDQILEAVRELAHGGSPMSAHVARRAGDGLPRGHVDGAERAGARVVAPMEPGHRTLRGAGRRPVRRAAVAGWARLLHQHAEAG